MKNFTIATAAAAGFAAAFVGLAVPALAAPSGTGSAADTISALEEQGNRVIVNRQSGAALSDASVVSVRQGAELREYTWDAQGDDRILETVGRVIFVDVK
ncbi:hypothetical protein [Mycolicibacterium pyrenivorans]|uniref:hypothetical protein n=1 Tax=Mycolicibacterium pyrenivorans TaxID=187102 RepID=UPI000A8C6D0C|nr:hypothetical protein [Mycolicibacterium pyrenivorans]MCV7149862.1 hypothetical protein [Mycolicibacterium pyrenivorans]